MPETRPRRIGLGWIASLCWSAGLGVLIFANTVLLQGGSSRTAAPASNLQPNWSADFPGRIDAVTAALARSQLGLPTPNVERQGSGALRWMHRRYELTIPKPDSGTIEQMLEPARDAASGVTLEVTEHDAGAWAQIGIDGLLTHTVMVHWLDRRPRAAIIVDDLGNDLLTARELVAIDAPLTLAIMPFRPFSKQVAELAALFGREVLLNLPMDAADGTDTGAERVLSSTADHAGVLAALNDGLADVPHSVGVNNHLGPRFTTDRERMRWILERLKEESLFFIDSRTTPSSVACEIADTVAVPCATRSLFLDNGDEAAAITAQLQTLVQLARTRGDVIGITHSSPATVAALQTALPTFAANKVDVVPVSAIVGDRALSRR